VVLIGLESAVLGVFALPLATLGQPIVYDFPTALLATASVVSLRGALMKAIAFLLGSRSLAPATQ
jgi:hypothetical protein